ncbi:Fis family transcriptional regulator [Pseudomonas alcaligenes]|uniref:Fis family transcriptional regulator n=1 Tax=Aquipseudomonas alcaligenes TaxID=43263 RepID=A0ABR7S1G2_AQUAC|nr:sigma-54 dependent transcriptional regulator [Pseudomonas alcaligenes]MBC9250799.1 Fis family transcriptional regulator [Pseudomonas alcaligenes]
MLQVAAATPRRLLVVDPCPECERLLPGLRAGGWTVHSCGLDEAGAAPCDVGLIRLDARHLQRPERLKQLISQSGSEWIALLGAEILQQPEAGHFIGEWFFDSHTLPCDAERVGVALGQALGLARLRGKVVQDGAEHGSQLLGSSRSMLELRHLLDKLAASDAPVLIGGESGSGKGVVARTLHRLSRRAAQPFVAVNCAAIAGPLLHAELFGHAQGANGGTSQHKVGYIEAAAGGTLFLEEVGDLPLELQASLLRLLQEKKIERAGGGAPVAVNMRVLAASRIDLEAAIHQGRFRQDLYERLSVLQAQTTPLRERRVDVRSLAEYFARRYAAEIGRRPRSFNDKALGAMGEHSWPGNVRELANRVRRATVLAEGRQIMAADLGLAEGEVPLLGTLDDYICRAEQQALNDVLLYYSSNMSQAARVLGVSRPTFYRLLHKHRLR